jgi:hypothetical protein
MVVSKISPITLSNPEEGVGLLVRNYESLAVARRIRAAASIMVIARSAAISHTDTVKVTVQ